MYFWFQLHLQQANHWLIFYWKWIVSFFILRDIDVNFTDILKLSCQYQVKVVLMKCKMCHFLHFYIISGSTTSHNDQTGPAAGYGDNTPCSANTESSKTASQSVGGQTETPGWTQSHLVGRKFGQSSRRYLLRGRGTTTRPVHQMRTVTCVNNRVKRNEYCSY